jgi:hypothetical protein
MVAPATGTPYTGYGTVFCWPRRPAPRSFAEESRSPGRLHTVESQGTPCALVTIDQIPAKVWLHYLAMKVTEKQALAVRCPTCGAKPGEKCELSTGLPRTEPHRDRRLVASDK